MIKAFKIKQKAFFIIFKGLSVKQITQFFLEGESPTLILIIFDALFYFFLLVLNVNGGWNTALI